MSDTRIWWHSATQLRPGNFVIPLVDEPELSAETVTTTSGGAAVASGAAPDRATVAVIAAAVDVHFRVQAGGTGAAATTGDKTAKAGEERQIAVRAGDKISVLEP